MPCSQSHVEYIHKLCVKKKNKSYAVYYIATTYEELKYRNINSRKFNFVLKYLYI